MTADGEAVVLTLVLVASHGVAWWLGTQWGIAAGLREARDALARSRYLSRPPGSFVPPPPPPFPPQDIDL